MAAPQREPPGAGGGQPGLGFAPVGDEVAAAFERAALAGTGVLSLPCPRTFMYGEETGRGVRRYETPRWTAGSHGC